MAAHVPASDNGTVMPAAIVGRGRRRNTNTTSITSTTDSVSVSCMSCTLARMVVGAVGQHRDVDAGGDPALELGDQRA